MVEHLTGNHVADLIRDNIMPCNEDGSEVAKTVKNTAKETNVTTDLSAGAVTANTVEVESSDGTNATINQANTDDAGVLSAAKWNEIVANTSASHAESHTIVSHNDTTGTGAELDTLTDNSIADALHRHSELVASDGSPDPAVSVDDAGNVGFRTDEPLANVHLRIDGDATFRIEGDEEDDFARLHLRGGSVDGFITVYGDSVGRSLEIDATDSVMPIIFLLQGVEKMRLHHDGNFGVNDPTPSFKLDVNGDGRFTGKLTTLGSVDPPGVLYDRETRASTVARVKREVPKDKLGGCFMFYNGESGNMELYFPTTGEFKDFAGELIDSVEPITETYATVDKYHLDELTGEVIKTQVEAPENKKYKVKKDYKLDSKTGKFYDKHDKEVAKDKATEHITKVYLIKNKQLER